MKPTRLCERGLLFRFSGLNQIYYDFAVYGGIFRCFAVSNRPLCPPSLRFVYVILQARVISADDFLHNW